MRRNRQRTDASAPAATEAAAAGAPRPEAPAGQPFCSELLFQFDEHNSRLATRARERRSAVLLKSTVLDKEERQEASELSLLGVRQPADEFQGDVNLRTLRSLLKMIDDRGFERYVASFPEHVSPSTPQPFHARSVSDAVSIGNDGDTGLCMLCL